MQFVPNGPDIPDSLLQAHEEGHVVFFCGAGISCQAGLPGFDGLVKCIYRNLAEEPDPNEKEAYEKKRFDETLDLLERRITGQRTAVRNALAQVLKPNLRRKGDIETHRALLNLARSRDGYLRLVTTNCDRVFEDTAKRTRQPHNVYAAPMLPIPKDSRWNGLVYLHGLLPNKPDDDIALNQLVITSGDFGLAYLTERWAARFVGELFRNYTVCFVGYSIDDPILRYMMDALAADRMMGAISSKAYAFGDYHPGQELEKKVEWAAKGVTPILYNNSKDHAVLHKTLKAWSKTYCDGVRGKERIVLENALAKPSESIIQDDFVGRMLWALSDKSGIPAKRFAEFNPVPSLEWLKVFSEERYKHDDLNRFGVPSHSAVDEKLRFSITNRPAPYDLAPRMALVSDDSIHCGLDMVMFNLSQWLTRHLNNSNLILWITERGNKLHKVFAWQIEQKFDLYTKMERDGKIAELEEIRKNAPNAIPTPFMRKLWRLLLSNHIKYLPRYDIYQWVQRLLQEPFTFSMQLELRELLAPKIKLEKPFLFPSNGVSKSTESKPSVQCKLELATDYVRSALPIDQKQWQESLPLLFDDFQRLLCDALDLLTELGQYDDYMNDLFFALPSISSYRRNNHTNILDENSWTLLIELVWDAWLSIRNNNIKRAAQIAQAWFKFPYPTFKRLALVAAIQTDCIAPEHWVDWLLANNKELLWCCDTQWETIRLLELQGKNLSLGTKARLEEEILVGPPPKPKTFFDDISEGDKQKIDYSIWWRLAKLKKSGVPLGKVARNRLNTLSKKYPEWQISDNECGGVITWTIGPCKPNHIVDMVGDTVPTRRLNLVKWLKQPPEGINRHFSEDKWRGICRKHALNVGYALFDLVKEGVWPIPRNKKYLEYALYAWAEKVPQCRRTWLYFASQVQTWDDSILRDILYGFTQWLEKAAQVSNQHENILLELCRRVMKMSPMPELDVVRYNDPSDQPISDAINHPIGHVTQVLLSLWFKRKPEDGDLLPGDIKPIFTELCDTHNDHFRHGKVMLTVQLISLFRVDPQWTKQHLLPLLDWTKNQAEAKALWAGFFWSPRLFQPLMIALKSQFLETAKHYVELGDAQQHFATFLTVVALDHTKNYKPKDFKQAISSLTQKGREEVAHTLVEALKTAEHREYYFENSIRPFLQNIWPKDSKYVSSNIVESLAWLCIEARGAFPLAVETVFDWLKEKRIEYPARIIIPSLQESDLCAKFPDKALSFLDTILHDNHLYGSKLRQCLDAIEKSKPILAKQSKFIRLREYERQQNN